MWIEIFRTGSHTDSSGRTEAYTEDTLDRMSEIYNSRINESTTNEAPLVKGHPSTDEPAYGWIERLARRGQSLMAKLKDVAPELIDEVSKGMFKKVSSAFYPDLMLRHVGLLGAVPLAVKGLRTVSFAGSEFSEHEVEIALSYNFEEDPSTEFIPNLDSGLNETNEESFKDEVETHPCTSDIPSQEGNEQPELDELIEKLDEENRKLKKAIEEMERDIRKKEFSEYVNSLIDHPGGSLIKPSQQDSLLELLEFASEIDNHKSDNAEFNESDSLVHKVKVFVSGFEPIVSMKEFAVRRNEVKHQSEPDFHTKNVAPERLKLHERAKEIQSENPNISYEEAVTQVQRELQLINN
ncbi:MAG: hypothetical protein EPN82_13210 [Bacteroidetes bacterium]|nr:MAG: hypothetical protein EPN82_13210 [Bacteroidota bacterium]